jgi:hypothetical protein
VKLLDPVRQTARVMHYSIRIQDADVYWIERYIRFHNNRHLNTMGPFWRVGEGSKRGAVRNVFRVQRNRFEAFPTSHQLYVRGNRGPSLTLPSRRCAPAPRRRSGCQPVRLPLLIPHVSIAASPCTDNRGHSWTG